MALRQLARFAVVGGLNTALTYGIYLFFLEKIGCHYQVALMAEYSVGIVFGFAMNRSWTFRRKGAAGEAHSAAMMPGFLRYATTYVGVYLANVLLLSAVVESGTLSPELGQIAVLGVISLANFFVQKHWVFRGRDTGSDAGA